MINELSQKLIDGYKEYNIEDAKNDLMHSFVIYGTGIIDVSFGSYMNFDVTTIDGTYGTFLACDKNDDNKNKIHEILETLIENNEHIVNIENLVFRFLSIDDINKFREDFDYWYQLENRNDLIAHKR